jgi:hypothetical protein
VYSRTLDGRPLTLAPSGWTYRRTFVLYDKETLSLWYPVRGGLRGISGKHLDGFLPRIRSMSTQWRWWIDDHPNSKVLK